MASGSGSSRKYILSSDATVCGETSLSSVGGVPESYCSLSALTSVREPDMRNRPTWSATSQSRYEFCAGATLISHTVLAEIIDRLPDN